MIKSDREERILNLIKYSSDSKQRIEELENVNREASREERRKENILNLIKYSSDSEQRIEELEKTLNDNRSRKRLK